MRKIASACAQALVACLVAAAVPVALAPSVHAQLEAKRSEAASLQTRIAEQGRALSIANERFNAAQIQRQEIAAKATSARGQVTAASERWAALKAQLARRVRLLYMHPAAAIDAWLGSKSLADLARAQKLGSSVLTADTKLVMATEKARHEVMARAKTLEDLESQARGKENELAGRRNEVSGALANQKVLLGKVNGEIAQLMEEERQRQLAAARALQAQEERRAPDGPALIDGDDDDRSDRAEPEEPVGPPPPVKGGAAKAVATAAAQLGKPYEWAADGPDSFDCSGLTMYAWQSAGVSLPHSSQAQYSSLPHVARSQLRPGDLLFYGSPIHHVGIYEGGGVMINAPETGETVRRDSIARADYVGAARP